VVPSAREMGADFPGSVKSTDVLPTTVGASTGFRQFV
jgi:hypothetical protein